MIEISCYTLLPFKLTFQIELVNHIL